MSISFNLIPNLLFTPGTFIEIDNSRAVQGLAALPLRVLLIGARRSTGTVAEAVLTPILSKDDGDLFFGRGSQLAGMCRAFKQANPLAEVWAIALDVSGTAATKTITVTGTATSAGTLHFLVGGKAKDVPVASGDANTVVAASIDSEFAEEEADWMYTFGVASGVVTGTSRHAAAFSQDFDIRLNYYDREVLDMPAGITIAIADATSGATDPSISTALAALPAMQFTKIVSGFNGAANVALLEAYLESQWGPLVQNDGMGYVAVYDNYADTATYGGARNSQFTCVMGAGISPTPWWEWAAVVAAVDAQEPDPARPRQTLKLPGVLPPARDVQFDQSERNLLLQTGISTYTVDQAGVCYIERLITTYQTNALGVADTSFFNIETMHTLAALRYTCRVRIATKYPRHKLASDGANYGPGQAVVTPKVIRGELIALFREWETNAWVEDFDQFVEELIVERNASDPDRLDARLGPNLVNQFRVMAAQIQFIN